MFITGSKKLLKDVVFFHIYFCQIKIGISLFEKRGSFLFAFYLKKSSSLLKRVMLV